MNSPIPTLTPLWTAAEAAAYLKISVDHLYRLAAAGRVPGRKVGRAWRFDPEALARVGVVPAPERVPMRVVEPAPHQTVKAPPAARPRSRRKVGGARAKLAAVDPYARTTG